MGPAMDNAVGVLALQLGDVPVQDNDDVAGALWAQDIPERRDVDVSQDAHAPPRVYARTAHPAHTHHLLEDQRLPLR